MAAKRKSLVMLPDRQTVARFRRKVLTHYRTHRRNLPWRNNPAPYAVLISEVMLQQTQASRVIPYFERFISTLPDINSLASAAPETVLRLWSGVGYNSRALRLRQCAISIRDNHNSIIPSDPLILITLPGIGEYTAGAIAAFAYNKPVTFYDTNIRRVLIAELNLPESITKTQLLSILHSVLPKKNHSEWYNALMDYGALKLTAKSTGIKPLSRQNTFKGSVRQVRGHIIKQLAANASLRLSELRTLFPNHDITSIIQTLISEGMPIEFKRNILRFTTPPSP